MIMTANYFLQLSESERRSLTKQTRRAANAKDAADIDAIHDSLGQLEPNHAFILEIPDDYDASKIKFTSSLEIPVDVMVIRNKGNKVVSEVIEHLRDSDKIKRVVVALQMSALLVPLMEAVNALARTLNDACETTAPDLTTVVGALYAFAPVLTRGTQEVKNLKESIQGNPHKDRV